MRGTYQLAENILRVRRSPPIYNAPTIVHAADTEGPLYSTGQILAVGAGATIRLGIE